MYDWKCKKSNNTLLECFFLTKTFEMGWILNVFLKEVLSFTYEVSGNPEALKP